MDRRKKRFNVAVNQIRALEEEPENQGPHFQLSVIGDA